MSYLPDETPNQLQGERLDAYNKINDIAEKSFGENGSVFKYKREDGSLLGPFPFVLAEPQSGIVFLDLVSALSKIELSSQAKETAILVTGTHFKAAYELYAHGKVAEKAGLGKAQIDAIMAGQKPSDLNAECNTAYDVALHLSSKPGALPKKLWDRSVEQLGHDGTIGLISYIGYYAYVCIVLNATNAQVPS